MPDLTSERLRGIRLNKLSSNINSHISSVICYGGFLAAAYGDLPPMACLQEEVQKCAKTLDIAGDPRDCLKLGDVETCLKKASTDCKVTDVADDLGAFMKVLKDLCNPTSDLAQEFIKSSKCLENFGKTSVEGSSCIKKLRKLYESDEDMLKKVLQLTKEICETQSQVLDCLYKEVEKACEKGAKDAVATVVRPVSNMLTKSCKESGYQTGVGSGTSALSWSILAASCLLFFLRWLNQ